MACLGYSFLCLNKCVARKCLCKERSGIRNSNCSCQGDDLESLDCNLPVDCLFDETIDVDKRQPQMTRCWLVIHQHYSALIFNAFWLTLVLLQTRLGMLTPRLASHRSLTSPVLSHHAIIRNIFRPASLDTIWDLSPPPH